MPGMDGSNLLFLTYGSYGWFSWSFWEVYCLDSCWKVHLLGFYKFSATSNFFASLTGFIILTICSAFFRQLCFLQDVSPRSFWFLWCILLCMLHFLVGNFVYPALGHLTDFSIDPRMILRWRRNQVPVFSTKRRLRWIPKLFSVWTVYSESAWWTLADQTADGRCIHSVLHHAFWSKWRV